jgi:hypothetical protein
MSIFGAVPRPRLGSAVLMLISWCLPVFAQTHCDPLGGAITQLEHVKTEFASGQYAEFFEYVDARLTDAATDGDALTVMNQAFSSGFESCQTIVSTRVSERLVSEIILFYAADGRVLFLAWDAIDTSGDWWVVRYLLSDNFDEISQGWM